MRLAFDELRGVAGLMKGRILFGVTALGTIGGVYYVHKLQMDERERMYDGVLRDLERQRKRREGTSSN